MPLVGVVSDTSTNTHTVNIVDAQRRYADLASEMWNSWVNTTIAMPLGELYQLHKSSNIKGQYSKMVVNQCASAYMRLKYVLLILRSSSVATSSVSSDQEIKDIIKMYAGPYTHEYTVCSPNARYTCTRIFLHALNDGMKLHSNFRLVPTAGIQRSVGGINHRRITLRCYMESAPRTQNGRDNMTFDKLWILIPSSIAVAFMGSVSKYVENQTRKNSTFGNIKSGRPYTSVTYNDKALHWVYGTIHKSARFWNYGQSDITTTADGISDAYGATPCWSAEINLSLTAKITADRNMVWYDADIYGGCVLAPEDGLNVHDSDQFKIGNTTSDMLDTKMFSDHIPSEFHKNVGRVKYRPTECIPADLTGDTVKDDQDDGDEGIDEDALAEFDNSDDDVDDEDDEVEDEAVDESVESNDDPSHEEDNKHGGDDDHVAEEEIDDDNDQNTPNDERHADDESLVDEQSADEQSA